MSLVHQNWWTLTRTEFFSNSIWSKFLPLIIWGGDTIVVVYSDDLVITKSTKELILSWKDDIIILFDIIDLSLLHYCLGFEVWYMQYWIFISYMKYTKGLLDKFRMLDCEPMSTPIEPSLYLLYHDYSTLVNVTLYHKLIRGLIYLAHIRLDIFYTISYLSIFTQKPKKSH